MANYTVGREELRQVLWKWRILLTILSNEETRKAIEGSDPKIVVEELSAHLKEIEDYKRRGWFRYLVEDAALISDSDKLSTLAEYLQISDFDPNTLLVDIHESCSLEPYLRAIAAKCESLPARRSWYWFTDEYSPTGLNPYVWFLAYIAAAENRNITPLLQLLNIIARSHIQPAPMGSSSWAYIILCCLLMNDIKPKIYDTLEGRICVSVNIKAFDGIIDTRNELQLRFFIDEKSSRGLHQWRLVHYAAAWGDIACMEIFIDHDATLATADNQGCNVAHLAAYHGHSQLLSWFMLNRLKLLQASTPMFLAKDKRGRTPLHYASEQGYLAAVQVLLEDTLVRETGVDAVDHDGLTALHLAACQGRAEVVEELLKRGAASPSLQSSQDLSLRRFSAASLQLSQIRDSFSYEDTRVMQGVDHYTVCYHCESFLPSVISPTFLELEAYVSSDAIGLKPNFLHTEVWSPKGFTALHFAVVYGNNSDTVLKILEHGSGGAGLIAIKDSSGLTPADWAAASAFTEAQAIFSMKGQSIMAEADELGRARYCESAISRRLKEARIQSYYLIMKEAECERRRLQWTVDMANALLYKHWNEAQNLTLKGINDLKIKINRATWKHLQWAIDYTLRYSADHIRQHRGHLIEKLVVSLVEASAFSDHDSSSTLQMCLMWAIKKKVMVDLVEAIVKLGGQHKCDLLSIARGCEHKESPLEAATYMGEGAIELVAVMEGQEEVRRRLYEDRQVYVDYANTILVAAVLIAGLAFQAWVQQPQGYKAMPLKAASLGMRVFDWCNSWGFFFSMGAVMAAAAGAMPIRSGHIIKFLLKSKQTATAASILMAASVACQVVGFSSALVSLQQPSHAGVAGMVVCSTVGIILVFVFLVLFLVRVHQLQPLGLFGLAFLEMIKSWIFGFFKSLEMIKSWILRMCRGLKESYKDFLNDYLMEWCYPHDRCREILTRELRQFEYAFRIVGFLDSCTHNMLSLITESPELHENNMSPARTLIERLHFALIYAPFKLLLFNLVYVYVLQPVIPSHWCSAAPASSSRRLAVAVYKRVCCSFQIAVTPLVVLVYLLLWLFIHASSFLIRLCYSSPALLIIALNWSCHHLYNSLFSSYRLISDGLRKLYRWLGDRLHRFSDWLHRLDQKANELLNIS